MVRYPGEGNSYPLQYSGLENSIDCIVHGVTKSQSRLSNFHFQIPHTSWNHIVFSFWDWLISRRDRFFFFFFFSLFCFNLFYTWRDQHLESIINLLKAIQLLSNTENLNLSLMLKPMNLTTISQTRMLGICEKRVRYIDLILENSEVSISFKSLQTLFKCEEAMPNWSGGACGLMPESRTSQTSSLITCVSHIDLYICTCGWD